MMKSLKNKGSIMIWTLLLGISLTTVFFFFSQRLNANVAAQRETIEHVKAEAFINSYADYIEQLDLANTELKEGDIGFYGIEGTLTNDVLSITGSLDAGEESAEYKFSDEVTIEWNLCSDNKLTDITVEDGGDTTYEHPAGPACASSLPGYDDEVTIMVNDPFKIKAQSGPLHYRITSTTPDTNLEDNVWHLNVELPIGFRKKFSITRTFTPQP